MEAYGISGKRYEKWQPHTEKYDRAYFAVQINQRWVEISLCTCGSVHTYEILEKEPDSKLSRKDISELSEEIRNHLLERVRPVKPRQEEPLVSKK